MPWPLVSSAWLAGALGEQDLRILDCSVVMRTQPDGTYSFVGGREEWEAGHIPRSAFVDVLGRLKDKSNPLPLMLPPAEQLVATMAEHGVGAETRVVLYDRANHAWAARVWWMLRVFGFDAAAVLDGGFRKWQAEGRPVSSAPDVPAPAKPFVPRHRPELIADKAGVKAALGSAHTRLVNALTPEQHRGSAKSSYPRAGRIPGSVNVHCETLIDPTTHAYLSIDELRARFAAAGALGADRTITYCGAGVAASSDALALTAIGVTDIAVYDGSMAEWSADASLPIETG